MLYYIDKSVASTVQKKELSNSQIWFFTRLAVAARYGRCYLCGDSESLKILSKAVNYPQSGVFATVLSKHAEHGAIMRAVKKVFVLTFSENGEGIQLPDIIREPGKHQFVSIDKAISEEWALDEKCCLLSENLTDNAFYRLIGTHFCSQNGYESIKQEFHDELGGGGTTAVALQKCISYDKKPTLCIIDSDKKYNSTSKYPTLPAIGNTLKEAQKVIAHIDEYGDSPPHCLYALHTHEVENLIPISVLSNLDQAKIRNGREKLNQLISHGLEEAILYYDFKNGFPYIVEKPKRQYWGEILVAMGGSEKEMPPDIKPTDIDNQKCFFPAVGRSDLLKEAIKIMKNTEYQVDEYLSGIWNSVGELVFTWGCACSPLRV